MRTNITGWLCIIAAASAAAMNLFVIGLQRKVTSLRVFLIRLLPFGLAAIGIGLVPIRWVTLSGFGLVPPAIGFLVIFCWIIPKIFFDIDEFEKVYCHFLLMVPTIIILLQVTYRLGGGSGFASVRLATGLMLLMLSGLEDLAFLTVNHHDGPPWKPIPEVWEWAGHIAVRLGGRKPTKRIAYVFITVHVLVAVIILLLPDSIWFAWLHTVVGR